MQNKKKNKKLTEGEGFMRWNIACPRSVVREGWERFRRFVRSLE